MVRLSSRVKRRLMALLVDFALSIGAIIITSKATDKRNWKFKRKTKNKINRKVTV